MKSQDIVEKYNDYVSKIRIIKEDLYKITSAYNEDTWKSSESPSVRVLYDYLTVIIEESVQFNNIMWDKKNDPNIKKSISIINLYLEELETEKNSSTIKKHRAAISEKIELLNEILEDINE